MSADAVGFDLGDTLVEYEGVPLNWQREYPTALAAVATVWGAQLSDGQLAAGIDVLRRFNTRVTPRDHEVDHHVVFNNLLPALGLDDVSSPGLMEDSVDAFFSVFQRKARVVPGALELIAALHHAALPVAVLTDVPYGMPRRLVLDDLAIAGLADLGDATITSVEVGQRKPSAVGFELLAAQVGMPTERVLFVGNERKDVAGAKSAGMIGVLLWRGTDSIPSWEQDFTVSGLDELMRVLTQT